MGDEAVGHNCDCDLCTWVKREKDRFQKAWEGKAAFTDFKYAVIALSANAGVVQLSARLVACGSDMGERGSAICTP